MSTSTPNARSTANRVVLVTGGGRGIGRAIAEGLGASGARVAVSARTASELAEVCEAVEAAGGKAFAVVADLGDAGAPQHIVDAVSAHWGPIEVLVNNAGIGSSASPLPLESYDDDFWELSMRINVTAPYKLTRLTLPAMLAAGWGRIINIASINGKVPSMHGAAYTASKHAVIGLTKATALEVGTRGITANAVCPGVTATEMNNHRISYDAKRLGKTLEEVEQQASQLGRRLYPEEVAAMAVFLAGDAACAVNGQSLNVCGGVCYA